MESCFLPVRFVLRIVFLGMRLSLLGSSRSTADLLYPFSLSPRHPSSPSLPSFNFYLPSPSLSYIFLPPPLPSHPLSSILSFPLSSPLFLSPFLSLLLPSSSILSPLLSPLLSFLQVLRLYVTSIAIFWMSFNSAQLEYAKISTER